MNKNATRNEFHEREKLFWEKLKVLAEAFIGLAGVLIAIVGFYHTYTRDVTSDRFRNLLQVVKGASADELEPRLHAAVLLRGFGDEPSVPPILISMLGSKEPEVKRQAMASILWLAAEDKPDELLKSILQSLNSNWLDLGTSAKKNGGIHHLMIDQNLAGESNKSTLMIDDKPIHIQYGNWSQKVDQYAPRLVEQRNHLARVLLEAYKASNQPDIGPLRLQYTSLDGLDLTDLDLKDADLRGTHWRNCNLTRTDLTGALLYNARWDKMDLTDSKVMGVKTNNKTKIPGLGSSGHHNRD